MKPVAAPATVRSAVLLTHSRPEQTAQAVRAAAAAAERASCTLHVGPEERDKHGDAVTDVEVSVEAPDRADLCLVLGGDGMILKALRTFAGTDTTVFGVNFGTVGFLAAVEREDLERGLERAFGADFEVMMLPGLAVAVDTDHPVALNDVSITRKPHGRVAELAYRIAGEEVGHVRCDGLVASTPAGSTGYNLANQGPILAWGVEGYVVSYVAPHSLTARPLVVAPDDVLHVSNASGREPVDIALDGEPVGELPSGEELEIRFQDGLGRLAQLPGSSFYRQIREKFGHLAH